MDFLTHIQVLIFFHQVQTCWWKNGWFDHFTSIIKYISIIHHNKNIKHLHFIFISEQIGDHFKFSSLFTTTISTSNLPLDHPIPFIISPPPVSPSIMRAFRNCQIQHHLTSNITSESFNSTPILTTFPFPLIISTSISPPYPSSLLYLPHLHLISPLTTTFRFRFIFQMQKHLNLTILIISGKKIPKMS